MFKLCREAVAFNLLSRAAQGQFVEDNRFYYAEEKEILNYCSALTQKTALKNDYLTHDFTIFLHK